ncbi:hypothetical protein GO491_08905 [Flavobacteriaceae bacterium Ap0902]|nr:hypothetical protein [Flavobacteriaceae bacterium Ap0902]
MPYKKIIYTLCLLLLFVGWAQAQEQKINGLIVIDFKDQHPEGVKVINKQTQNSVFTNVSGSFVMNASVGDTLYFEGSFLTNRKLPVQKRHFELNPVIIHMNEEIIQLEEIVVRPALTGDLTNDMASVRFDTSKEELYANLKVDIRNLDLKPREKIGVSNSSEGMIPIPVTLNVGDIVNALNGDTRRLRNLYRYEDLEYKLTSIAAYFGENYFKQELDIEPHKARQFLLFLQGKEKQAYDLYFAQKDYLSIDHLMRKYAPDFIAMGDEDDISKKLSQKTAAFYD